MLKEQFETNSCPLKIRLNGKIMAKKPLEKTSKTHNYASNRLKRLVRHLKKHPNDEQANEALKSNKVESTRKSSINKLGWTSSNKDLDTLLRSKFVGSVTKELLTKHAQIISFCKKAPFLLSPVLVSTKEGPSLELKHISKLSNFKPKPQI